VSSESLTQQLTGLATLSISGGSMYVSSGDASEPGSGLTTLSLGTDSSGAWIVTRP